MSRLLTFSRGGIHPPGRKGLTEGDDIHNCCVPGQVVIPFSQHIGAPSKPVVSVGDIIKDGDLIASAEGFVSANIHSSVPGEVKEIKEIYLPNGRATMAAVIERAGEFSMIGKDLPENDWKNIDVEKLVSIIQEKGIVGMGGATFPTHVKLKLPEGKKCEYFIVNGVECEPYLTSDHKLMLSYYEEIITGIEIIQKILSPEKTVIGIEADKMDAVKVLKDEIKKRGLNIKVQPLKVQYPQGAEKMLIEAIAKKELPFKKLPLDIGVVNINVGTLSAIYDAVVKSIPLMERLVTVTGKGVKQPGTYRVKVGTSIKELLDECGGLTDDAVKIISGGPMMGFTFFDLETPVTKGTSGVLVLTKKEIQKSSVTSCLSCGRCINSCPMGVNPRGMYKSVEFENIEDAIKHGVEDCCECGSCAYNCPAHLPMVQMFRVGKAAARRFNG